MSFLRWLRNCKRGAAGRGSSRRAPGCRPALEALEDRLAPAVIFVTTTGDNGDNASPYAGSLREAILRANASPGFDEIKFSLPGIDPGHYYYATDNSVGTVKLQNRTATTSVNDLALAGVIDPDHPHSWWSIGIVGTLPVIQGACLIDGWTQHGVASDPVNFPLFEQVPVVELDGTLADNNTTTGIGLRFSDFQGEVRGLIINRFPGPAIESKQPSFEDFRKAPNPGTRIFGNFIGTDPSGLIAATNGRLGSNSVRFLTSGTSGSVGNPANSNALGALVDPANPTGQANPAHFRNLIVNDINRAVNIQGLYNTVEANLMGTSRDGVARLGNAGGIFVSGDHNRIVSNTIAAGGVFVFTSFVSSDYNSFLANSIYGITSGQQGIELGLSISQGRDVNDFKDVDIGGFYANRGQNYPILQSATYDALTGFFTVSGRINTEPNRTVRLEFFANPDTSNGREGRTYLGFVNATTDSNGDTGFVFPTTTWDRSMGSVITATATMLESFSTSIHGATSEFSDPFTFVAPRAALSIAATTLPAQRVVGTNEFLTYTLTVTNTSTEPARNVEVFSQSQSGDLTIVGVGPSLGTWRRNGAAFVVDAPELAPGASMTIDVFAQLEPDAAPVLRTYVDARADNADLIEISFDVPVFYPQIVLNISTNTPIELPAGLSHELHFTARIENGGIPMTAQAAPATEHIDRGAFENMTGKSDGLSRVFMLASADSGVAEFIVQSDGIPGGEFIEIHTIFPEQGYDVELFKVFEIQWLNDVTVELAPQTATQRVGLPQAMTVTVTKGGLPAAGEQVVFDVSGVNTATATLSTDAQGRATFTYTGSNVGDDAVTVSGRADNVPFQTSSQVTWTPAGKVNGKVYNDLNKNGQQDPGEPGVAGRDVYVDLDGNGGPDAGEPTATTADDGGYLIASVPTGSYTVNLGAQPAGWVATTPVSVPVTVVQQQTATVGSFGVAQSSVPPTDADGIPDNIEDEAPNFGDGNNDGIFDRHQAAVASLSNSVTNRSITLATTAGYLSDVLATGSPSLSDMPAGVQFPVGFFDFTVMGLNPGGAATVTLYLPANAAVDTYYKYGREPVDKPATALDETTTNHWYEFVYDGTTGAETHAQNSAIPVNQIVLHFVDGQRGDDDLATNGSVVDPGAPAFANAAPLLESLRVGGITPLREGDSVSLSGVFSDANAADTHRVDIDWDGDGTFDQTLSPAAGVYSFNATHEYLDDGPAPGNATPADDYSIKVRVSDPAGAAAEGSVVVTVHNAVPAISALANSAAEVGKTTPGQKVFVSADFTDVGRLDLHTAVIDWGDGSHSAAAIAELDGGGSASGNHVYQAGGVYTITVTLADDDGAEVSRTMQALITGAAVRDTVLYVVGTSLDDKVTIGKQGRTQLKVHADFLPQDRTFTSAGITRIEIHLGAGDDHARIADSIVTPAFIDGGSGDDQLEGGGGPSILLGGDGDDQLQGLSGRDLLIGGRGADKLHGNKGGDILIAGYTAWDANATALFAIMEEWTRRDRSYEERIMALRQGGGANGAVTLNANPGIGAVTVFDDEARDKLTGNAGRDWLFANLDGDGQRAWRDKAAGAHDFADDLDRVP